MSRTIPTTFTQHASVNGKPFWNFRLAPLFYPFEVYNILVWTHTHCTRAYTSMPKPTIRTTSIQHAIIDNWQFEKKKKNIENLKRRLQQRRPHARSPLQSSKMHSKLDSFDEWKGELREGTARPPDVLVPLLGSLPPTQLESTVNKTFRGLNGFLGVERAGMSVRRTFKQKVNVREIEIHHKAAKQCEIALRNRS